MSPEAAKDLDQLAINTLRFLAVDMVEKANSGHPGAPMDAYAEQPRSLTEDPEFGPLMRFDPDAAADTAPMELTAYRVADAGKNCGSVCGCDGSKGVGCKGEHGENDDGGDCPYKVG